MKLLSRKPDAELASLHTVEHHMSENTPLTSNELIAYGIECLETAGNYDEGGEFRSDVKAQSAAVEIERLQQRVRELEGENADLRHGIAKAVRNHA